MQSSPAFTLDLSAFRSARVLAFVTVLGATIVPVFFTAIPAAARAMIAVGMFGLLLIGYRRAGWLGGPFSIQQAVWDADGRWFLSRGLDTWEAKLQGDSWINGAAMVLRWEAVDGIERHASMLVTAADLGSVVFRRLKIRLRIAGLRATTAIDALRP